MPADTTHRCPGPGCERLKRLEEAARQVVRDEAFCEDEPPTVTNLRAALADASAARRQATGAALIAAERRREIGTPIHDDTHNQGEMARAALSYLLFVAWPDDTLDEGFWPWDLSLFEPSVDDPVRNLVRAGALIAAEIDRLLRAVAEAGGRG